eukprot:10156-Rhodomonas_salina.2
MICGALIAGGGVCESAVNQPLGPPRPSWRTLSEKGHPPRVRSLHTTHRLKGSFHRPQELNSETDG